jgi:hypothetical protein
MNCDRYLKHLRRLLDNHIIEELTVTIDGFDIITTVAFSKKLKSYEHTFLPDGVLFNKRRV